MDPVENSASSPPACECIVSGPRRVVHGFVRELIARHRAAPLLPHGASVTDRLTSLLLAEAVLRLARPTDAGAQRPPQVAVIGPTQVGKSTVVNLLVGAPVAAVSPLAGFTVQAQGFWLTADDGDAGWLADVFPDWRRCAADELNRAELATYSLRNVEPVGLRTDEPVTNAVRPALPRCTIWDTPDFDSLAAETYQRAVLETAALADVYLLVLSKEKYSDLSAWRMLRLLEPLRRPLVIVLNKLTSDSAELLINSLRGRLAELARAWGDVPVVALAYCPQADGLDAGPLLAELAPRTHVPRRPMAGVRALVEEHWGAWTTPVRAEHAALEAWRTLMDAALQEFLARYRRDYLEHPHRYDAFRRAAVELLHLLEIPHVSGWITKARALVTWPARQLWQSGRTWWDAWRPAAGGAARGNPETAVLFDALEALLTGLQRDVARRCSPQSPGYAVWRTIARRLETQEPALREVFRAALEAHHAQVTQEVRAVASGLYEELRGHPARLAALRGARATIDVGSILLAVKTGGLSPMDALWAPATFALSSLLMEGMTGIQMASTAHGLKQRQYEAVRTSLVERTLARQLRGLTESLADEGLLGISAEQLAAAEQALRDWEGHDDA